MRYFFAKQKFNGIRTVKKTMFGVARTIWRKTLLSYWEQLTNPTLIWHKTSQDRSDHKKSRFTKSWHHWHIHLGRLDAFGLSVCLSHSQPKHSSWQNRSTYYTGSWKCFPSRDPTIHTAICNLYKKHGCPSLFMIHNKLIITFMPRLGVATFGRRH